MAAVLLVLLAVQAGQLPPGDPADPADAAQAEAPAEGAEAGHAVADDAEASHADAPDAEALTAASSRDALEPEPPPSPDPVEDSDAFSEDGELDELYGPREAELRPEAPPEADALDEHLERRQRLTAEEPEPIAPLPVPFVFSTQLALAIGSPIFFGCLHYILTPLTLFMWPLVLYPLAVGYAVTCVGNSFGRNNKGAFFPMLAAFATSCAGWASLGALVSFIFVASQGTAFISQSPVALATQFLVVGMLPLPPIVAGMVASGVWAFTDTDALPGAGSLGRPRMMTEGSDTERLFRDVLGYRELRPPGHAVGRPQRF
jgi:hypothetical protein